LRQALHLRLALGGFACEKTFKHKSTFITGQACCADQSRDAAGAGHRHDALARLRQRLRQARPGVAHGRRAGIAHIGDALAGLQSSDDALRGLALIVFVHRQQRLADAVDAQHALCVARVFAGDGINHTQHMQGAQRDIGQIADGGGHHIERAVWINLSPGCRLRSSQSKRKISFHSALTFMFQAKSIAANPRLTNQPAQRPSTKAVGDGGEQIALDYLSARGLMLVARNFKTSGRGGGEIDLIMRAPDGTLVFIEVRQRKNASHGGAAASVSALKRARIVFAARHYLSRLRTVPPCRFDVLSVQGEGAALQVQWLQAAFDAS